jgi:S-formylglutathione hydrolase FrmB
VSAPASAATPSRIVTRSFRSEALGGVDKTYIAYLPRGYDATSKAYPVLYLLHGYGGDETNWTRVGNLPQAADAIDLQAIVVMPDGDDSFYANWISPLPFDECLVSRPSAFGRTERADTYCVRGHRYEDYIVRDLVAHVEATYRAVPDRRARAIAGLSMGGFGALMLAMRHTDLFAITASHSGVVSPLYEAPHPYREGEVELRQSPTLGKEFPAELRDRAARVLGSDIANWRAHDPSTLAAGLKPGSLAIYIDCGTEDGFKLADQARHVHEVLTKAGVPHAFELAPGGHSFALWKGRIKNSLAFTAGEFKKAGY